MVRAHKGNSRLSKFSIGLPDVKRGGNRRSPAAELSTRELGTRELGTGRRASAESALGRSLVYTLYFIERVRDKPRERRALGAEARPKSGHTRSDKRG